MVHLAKAAVQESSQARVLKDECRAREVLEVHQRSRDAIQLMAGVAEVNLGEVRCERATFASVSEGKANLELIMQSLRRHITVTLPSLELHTTA